MIHTVHDIHLFSCLYIERNGDATVTARPMKSVLAFSSAAVPKERRVTACDGDTHFEAQSLLLIKFKTKHINVVKME